MMYRFIDHRKANSAEVAFCPSCRAPSTPQHRIQGSPGPPYHPSETQFWSRGMLKHPGTQTIMHTGSGHGHRNIPSRNQSNLMLAIKFPLLQYRGT